MSEIPQTKGLTVLASGERVACVERAGEGLQGVGEAHGGGMAFFQTNEYRRFVEMCEECRTSCLIGVCYGAAGVGKREASRVYARWDEIEPLLSWHGVVQPRLSPENPRPRAAFSTPTATVTARQLEKDLTLLRWSLRVIGEAARSVPRGRWRSLREWCVLGR